MWESVLGLIRDRFGCLFEADLALIFNRFGDDLGPSLLDLGTVWGRFWYEFDSVWGTVSGATRGRFREDLGAIRERCVGRFERSGWGRFVWGRFGIDLGSIWIRFWDRF